MILHPKTARHDNRRNVTIKTADEWAGIPFAVIESRRDSLDENNIAELRVRRVITTGDAGELVDEAQIEVSLSTYFVSGRTLQRHASICLSPSEIEHLIKGLQDHQVARGMEIRAAAYLAGSAT